MFSTLQAYTIASSAASQSDTWLNRRNSREYVFGVKSAEFVARERDLSGRLCYNLDGNPAR